MKKYDAVILGGGAAGLFCAMRTGQLGRKVLVLERGSKPGAKILISGGGRCNFTNRNIAADKYISENPHFCLSALKSYTHRDFIGLVDKHKIPYHEKTLGQLFCDGSAQQIIDMLLTECSAAQVEIRSASCRNFEAGRVPHKNAA
jgi:predicted flavoprotein YhiN